MKSAIVCLLALLLLSSASVVAQDDAAPVASAKALVVSGRVSQDGKMLLTDLDSTWSVANREALKGLEGLLVRMKCFVNPEKNSIQVLWVKKDSNEANYTAVRYSDSAFRR